MGCLTQDQVKIVYEFVNSVVSYLQTVESHNAKLSNALRSIQFIDTVNLPASSNPMEAVGEKGSDNPGPTEQVNEPGSTNVQSADELDSFFKELDN